MISVCIIACNNTQEKKGEKEVDLDINDVISKVQKDKPSTAAEGKKIYEKYADNLDKLLTLDMVARITGFAKEKAKTDYSKVLKSKETHSIRYSWESGRMKEMEVMQRKMTIPQDDEVKLDWFKQISLEEFKQNYRSLTDEEKATAETALKEAGIHEKDGSGNLASKMTEKSIKGLKVEEVPDISDYAAFVTTVFAGVESKELKVYHSGIMFSLVVNLKDDAAFNERKAMELAKAIVTEKLSMD